MSNDLTDKIRSLVDHLREKQDEDLRMSEVAMVTEVLMSTMQRYFRSIDTQIYKEFRELASYIEQAKDEISQLRPDDLKSEKLPRAGQELDAIVAATEEATNTIMESAEALMAIEADDPDTIKGQVMDECMKIFEACSFQDITGQRISKVVTTLTYIEDRLEQLQHVWWSSGGDPTAEAAAAPQDDMDDSHLLHGPALAGEGVDQSFVDNVDFEEAQSVWTDADAAAAETAAPADPAPAADAAPQDAPKEEKEDGKKDKGGSQADIDALFD